MKVRSLGYRTDLIFAAFDGQILDRGDYLAIRSPANPTFYWGNFLLFADPPREGDFDRWRRLFAKEIGTPPDVEHQVFGWDSPQGEAGAIEPFLQAGFDADRNVVLTTRAPHAPARPARSVNIRTLESDSDRQQAVELQVLSREPAHEEAGYRVYRQRAMQRYRKMSQAGLGHWYGAFIDGRLVADLGVFHDRQLGRYQSVETHPDYQRQGIGGTLIYEAGRQAIAQYGVHALVMVAEEDSAPARLYQSLGFTPKEKTVGLMRFPHAAR
jgi:ribosomal protein S18 acetylase RimI-like enzyme